MNKYKVIDRMGREHTVEAEGYYSDTIDTVTDWQGNIQTVSVHPIKTAFYQDIACGKKNRDSRREYLATFWGEVVVIKLKENDSVRGSITGDGI